MTSRDPNATRLRVSPTASPTSFAVDTTLLPQPAKSTKTPSRVLLIGFDTEYQVPKSAVSPEQIREGYAKNEVLSYQYHAKVISADDASEQPEWSGICLPPSKGDRISLSDFLTLILAEGFNTHSSLALPKTVNLIGHFTRADLPAFSDFKDSIRLFQNIRNTLLNIDTGIKTTIRTMDPNVSASLTVGIRDTLLLAPGSARSLAEIGKMLGHPKILLDEDPAKDLQMKRQMATLLKTDWALFRRYAINDATLCVRYAERLMHLYKTLTGTFKLPVTLSGIGVELLKRKWVADGVDQLDLLGKEESSEKIYDRQRGYYRNIKRAVFKKCLFDAEAFITETYHGGRNEQFCFGPSAVDDWYDYDLSSAYPTAMAMLGYPQWDAMRAFTSVSEIEPDSLAFADVAFAFPSETRFPVLPIRTDRGLIFPLSGFSSCTAPEIKLAESMGAKIEILKGLLVPTDCSYRPFAGYIKDCLERRGVHKKGTFENLFWKEIGNSTYGKTAQGLRKKRVFDLRAERMSEIPASEITNPAYASFVTGFVRAVLGEIINSLPSSSVVFSVTTDGFLTNADAVAIEAATQGPLCNRYRGVRESLANETAVLEIKHRAKQLLGWRTRGQATIVRAPDDDGSLVVLAKAGIAFYDKMDKPQENDAIVSLFLNRRPDDVVDSTVKTSIKEMLYFDADLVDKIMSRRLSMEFDFKRCPSNPTTVLGTFNGTRFDHLAFDSAPWESIDAYKAHDDAWQRYVKDDRPCLKSIADFYSYESFVSARTSAGDKASYLRKKDGDLKRLMHSLTRLFVDCGAKYRFKRMAAFGTWTSVLKIRYEGPVGRKKLEEHTKPMRRPVSEAPDADDSIEDFLPPKSLLRLRNTEFATILTSCGILCSARDVKNAEKFPFEPHTVPATKGVLAALAKLRERYFKHLDIALLLVEQKVDRRKK